MPKRFLLMVMLLAVSAVCISQEPRANVKGSYLLKTRWGGSAPFNALAPGGSTLGCHTNAIAQVMYYHKLAPYGKVSYKCTNGALVSGDFTGYAPQWDKFALDKESAIKDELAARETSRFMYYVASVIRKDFGTDQYVDYANDYHKKAVEGHFNCTLSAYAKEVKAGVGEALKAQPDFYGLLKGEVDSGRPAGFYYTDRKGGGHAVVIDGYAVKGGRIYFHANFGWFGRSDGWYLLEEDLPKNIKEIVVIAIVPKKRQSEKEKVK